MRPEVTIFPKRPSRRLVLALGAGAFGAAVMGSVVTALAASDKSNNGSGGADIGYMKPDAAFKAAQSGEIILIDIRRPDEWITTNVAEGAIGVDMREDDFVPMLVALRRANPDTPIALICRTGNRSEYVTTTLASQGFPGLVDVREGMVGGRHGPGWLKRGLPTYVGSAANVATRRKAFLQ